MISSGGSAFAYLFGCLLLAVIWLFIFLIRPDLRKNMLWASAVGAPFGLIDYFLVPGYWHPQSLFGFIPRFGVGLESFLFLFLMSGIASSLYEFMDAKRLVKDLRHKRHIATIVIFIFSFSIAYWVLHIRPMYAFILAGLIGQISAVLLRKDLLKQTLFVSASFSLLYGFVFFLAATAFPGLVSSVYNLGNISGSFVLGIPIEEILAAFFLGGFWSTTYEVVEGYRLRK